MVKKMFKTITMCLSLIIQVDMFLLFSMSQKNLVVSCWLPLIQQMQVLGTYCISMLTTVIEVREGIGPMPSKVSL